MPGMRAFLVLVFMALALIGAAAAREQGRSNRVIEEKVQALDEATRRRILAMQNAGMPKDAIAKKIAYSAGGEGTARRMLDRIGLDEKRKLHAHQNKQRQAAIKSTTGARRRR